MISSASGIPFDGPLGGLDAVSDMTRFRRQDTEDQRRFAEVLGIAERRTDTHQLSPEQQAREAAEGLIATAFIQPFIENFRELSDAAPPFQRTEAEKQFGALGDAQIALDIVRASRWPVVDELAQDLLRASQRSSASETSA